MQTKSVYQTKISIASIDNVIEVRLRAIRTHKNMFFAPHNNYFI